MNNKTEFIECPNCLGLGTEFDGRQEITCHQCNGEGKLEVWFDDEDPLEEGQDIDLLLDNEDFVQFDENKHTEI